MNLLLFVTVAICLVFVLCDRTMVQDDSAIDEINKLSPGWRAGHNPRFNNMTLDAASKLLGLAEVPINLRSFSPQRLVSSNTLPASFDSRQKWTQCIMPIRDQKNCGGCWGFAGASMFGMRQCIQSGGRVKIDMSPQYPISCDTANNGCNGGTIGGVWSFFQSSGAVAEYSYPFTSANGVRGSCALNSNAQKYYAASYRRLSTVAEMQQEIYDNGAIQVGFDVYQDFYNYRSGVYIRTSNVKSGGHSVYLVGWGTSNGTPYWIAVNSWSANWGMGGTFYIRRGTNECNIETGYRPVAAVIRVTAAPTASATTTRAPTAAPATSYDTRGCWTCPAGFIHWFMRGITSAPNGDRCACVVNSGSTPTTSAPAPASGSYDTRGCWTCPANYIHWFQVGMASAPGGDKCACVPRSTPTTSAPANNYDTRGCWTCPAGFIHWFMKGITSAPNGDRCACVINSGGSTPTTSAPAPAPAGSYDTRGCWTCPANYIHWFQVGMASAPGGDKCACVPRSTPTTSAPASYDTRGCWTCPAGFIHWFMKGYASAPGGDRCACVRN